MADEDDEAPAAGVAPVAGVEYVVCPGCLQARPVPDGEEIDQLVCENSACPLHGQGPLAHFVGFLGGSRCPVPGPG